MPSDRIFGLVVILTALAYIASATQIQTSFLTDPVGSKTFPMMIGVVAGLCGLVLVVRPDPDPDWPGTGTWVNLGVALVVLVLYAYLLKPLGFLLPTAFTAGVLSYQIRPRPLQAVVAGVGLSVGLWAIFKYALGLGLIALPRALFG